MQRVQVYVRARVRTALCAAALLLVATGAAHAADEAPRAEARRIGYAGVAAYQAGDYATAHDRLEQAYGLLRVPSLGLWSARTLVKVGRLVEAEARYAEVGQLPTSVGDEGVQAKARADARQELEALRARIPTITVRVEGAPAASVAISVDGNTIAAGESRSVNPGKHSISGVCTGSSCAGGAQAQTSLTVGEGERKEATLSFAARAEPAAGAAALAAPPADLTSKPAGADLTVASHPEHPDKGATPVLRTAGWIAIATGGAALVAGGITGAVALSKKSSLDGSGNCSGSACNANAGGDVDSYNSMRTISGVTLIAGAVIAAAGVTMVVLSPGPSATAGARAPGSRLARIELSVSPTGTTLRGAF